MNSHGTNSFMTDMLMSSSALPPLGNLPSWARVSSLDRNRSFPKPFLRDRLPTLPPTGSTMSLPNVSEDDLSLMGRLPQASQLDLPTQDVENLSMSEKRRLVYYNKTIKYLQKKHTDTLDKLHAEIEQLKQENKDLQFKAIMKVGAASNAASAQSSSESNEKLKELRQMIKNSQARNNMLHFALRKLGVNIDTASPTLNIEKFKSEEFDSKDAESSLYDPEREDSTELLSPLPTIILPLGATLNPLRVRVEEGKKPRQPTLSQCDVIIRHLYKSNLKQMEENVQLRSDLRKLLFAKELRDKRQKIEETKSDEKVNGRSSRMSSHHHASPLLNEVNLSMSDDAQGKAPKGGESKAYMSQQDRGKKKIETRRSKK